METLRTPRENFERAFAPVYEGWPVWEKIAVDNSPIGNFKSSRAIGYIRQLLTEDPDRHIVVCEQDNRRAKITTAKIELMLRKHLPDLTVARYITPRDEDDKIGVPTCAYVQGHSLVAASAGTADFMCRRGKARCSEYETCPIPHQNRNANVTVITHAKLHSILKGSNRKACRVDYLFIDEDPTKVLEQQLQITRLTQRGWEVQLPTVEDICAPPGAMSRLHEHIVRRIRVPFPELHDALLELLKTEAGRDSIRNKGDAIIALREPWAAVDARHAETVAAFEVTLDDPDATTEEVSAAKQGITDANKVHAHAMELRDRAVAMYDSLIEARHDLEVWLSSGNPLFDAEKRPGRQPEFALPVEGMPDVGQLEELGRLFELSLIHPHGEPQSDRNSPAYEAYVGRMQQVRATEEKKITATKAMRYLVAAVKHRERNERLRGALKMTHQPQIKVRGDGDTLLVDLCAIELPVEQYHDAKVVVSSTTVSPAKLQKLARKVQKLKVPSHGTTKTERVLVLDTNQRTSTGSKSSLLKGNALTLSGRKAVMAAISLAYLNAGREVRSGRAALSEISHYALMVGQLKFEEAALKWLHLHWRDKIDDQPYPIATEHFNAVEGLNDYEEVRSQLTVGRTEPSREELRLTAEAWIGRSIPYKDKWDRLEQTYRAKDGTEYTTSDPFDEEPMLVEMVRSIAHAGVVQSDRLRGQHREGKPRATMYVLNSLDMTDWWGVYDRVVTLDELANPFDFLASKFLMLPLMNDGRLPLGGSDALATLMKPLGIETANSAKTHMRDRRIALGDVLYRKQLFVTRLTLQRTYGVLQRVKLSIPKEGQSRPVGPTVEVGGQDTAYAARDHVAGLRDLPPGTTAKAFTGPHKKSAQTRRRTPPKRRKT